MIPLRQERQIGRCVLMEKLGINEPHRGDLVAMVRVIQKGPIIEPR